MLRRDPTTIKLSPEDVLEFDEFVEHQKILKQQEAQQAQQNTSQTPQQTNPNDSNLHQNHNNTDLSPSDTLLQEQLNNSGDGLLANYKEGRSLQDRQNQSKNERIGVHRNQ
ncbi:uncharacterized protein KGF55_002958 [Candida pseudojiufengensis]|uniref:uncharacterized protein n=1 Tax=Candida pseudojiufengensis TaxID=497109 RepID=UPI002225510E|nr:uncharacterized protein KGF55_002958 [Candida pseudojiufengensis]KAI5963166.1 hypothetical protein KGF55_002958 [Candida pseudojiufengensis]